MFVPRPLEISQTAQTQFEIETILNVFLINVEKESGSVEVVIVLDLSPPLPALPLSLSLCLGPFHWVAMADVCFGPRCPGNRHKSGLSLFLLLPPPRHHTAGKRTINPSYFST